MATAIPSPRDVPTSFNYYTPIGDEKPFIHTYKVLDGQPQDNIGKDFQPAVVHDARGKQEEYGLSLDTSGFQFVKHESVEKDFTDDAYHAATVRRNDAQSEIQAWAMRILGS